MLTQTMRLGRGITIFLKLACYYYHHEDIYIVHIFEIMYLALA